MPWLYSTYMPLDSCLTFCVTLSIWFWFHDQQSQLIFGRIPKAPWASLHSYAWKLPGWPLASDSGVLPGEDHSQAQFTMQSSLWDKDDEHCLWEILHEILFMFGFFPFLSWLLGFSENSYFPRKIFIKKSLAHKSSSQNLLLGTSLMTRWKQIQFSII